MTLRRSPLLLFGVLLTALVAVLPGSAGASSRPAPPAAFRVGAATEDLTPTVPVYAGGFGPSAPIRRVDGALQVRAMYISNGHSAVAFAVVDAQGYFTSYQEGPSFGIGSIRQLAAAAMSKAGPAVGADDIIVQATHSHSAPTLEGVWGPVPTAYLRMVHDRTVAALVAAARNARPAHLQWSTLDAPSLDNISTAQYDSFPGWSQDGQLTVLRALAPDTGATIATYATVPAHPDIVCGACLNTLTADYFGAVRQSLDGDLGGISLVGPATLGREETPVQATGIGEMRWFATVVRSLVQSALAEARWVTDPTVAGVGSTLTVPGTNPALLALVAANNAPDSVKTAAFGASGEYPIDRADTPPYQTGSAVGVPLTALRIGPLAFTSMPGEPFPEIRLSLAKAAPGAVIVALSKGQDDTGYFYPSWVYPFAAGLYPTDQGTFSIAPQAGDQILQGQLANVAALGFQAAPLAVPAPLPADYAQALRPGLQALAAPPTSNAAPSSGGQAESAVVLQAIYAPADQDGAALAGVVHWSFGDGTTATSSALSFGGPCTTPNVAGNGLDNCAKTGPAYLTHRFRPGHYVVTVSGHDTDGNAVTWRMPVVVHSPAALHVSQQRNGEHLTDTVSETGGTGHLLAAHWRLSDGSTLSGTTVTLPLGPGSPRAVSVTATDGAGTATSLVR
jgi:hypothetical protein